MSLVGTFRTCPGGPTTSAPEGGTDLPRKQGHFRCQTEPDIALRPPLRLPVQELFATYSIFLPCNSALRPSVFSKFTFTSSPLKLSAHVCVSLCPRIRRSIESVFSFSQRPLTAL